MKLNYVGVFAIMVSCTIALTSCTPEMTKTANNEYKLMNISLTDKLLTSDYSATITGRQSVEIRPQISGVLTQVNVNEGAAVKKGETLFVIDQAPYKAALQTALANVESAKASVATAQLTKDSKQELFNQNVVSTFDLQTAQNALLVAQATLLQAQAQELIARTNLDYTVIKSPVNGVAGMSDYRVGVLVSPSIATPLLTVSDDSQMHVYFSMTEKQLLSLARNNGQFIGAIDSMPAIQLRLVDGAMYDQSGKIDAISGIVDASTGAITIRATFPNTNKVLRSGGSGNAIFPYNRTNCIVIPQTATYEIQDKIFAYKVIDGKAVSSPITVFPINNGTQYIVESGLDAGDTIIAEGAGLVREGTPVTPMTQTAEQNQPTK